MKINYSECLPVPHKEAMPENTPAYKTPGSLCKEPQGKEYSLQALTLLSITPLIRALQRWWLQRAERHYLICADVEQARAKEAQLNVAYYQKQAALARSAQQ